MAQIWYPAQQSGTMMFLLLLTRDAINYWKTKITAADTVDKEKLASLERIFVFAKTNVPLHMMRFHSRF